MNNADTVYTYFATAQIFKPFIHKYLKSFVLYQQKKWIIKLDKTKYSKVCCIIDVC